MTYESDEIEIRAFFDALAVRFQAVSEINLYLANHFNVFRYIEPGELKLSRIIRDLLDPRGDHGQGDVFLKLFLVILELPHHEIPGDCRVECEEATPYAENPRRRIDIYVDLRGFGIGIENKPWAGEQRGWITDYSDQLRKDFSDNFLLVFLTTENRSEPGEDQRKWQELKEARQSITIYYEREFKNWLKDCYRDCRAENVRRFLSDFIEYVDNMEGGMTSEHELEMVTKFLQSNPENFRIAHAVLKAWPEVFRRVVVDFFRSLKERLLETFGAEWVIQEHPPDRLRGKWVEFKAYKKLWNGNHAIALSFEEPECRDLGIGIWKNGDKVQSIEGLYALTETAIQFLGRPYPPSWEWCTTVKPEYRYWNTPETMELLTSGRMDALEYFSNWFNELKNAVEAKIDSA